MRNDLTHAVEDYLKAIYELSLEDGRASTTRLAEVLRVTPASVTGMVQKLAGMESPLIDYRKHRGVSLTPDGMAVALEIVRHHRLLEMFLHQKLGFAWDEVHEEADRLEHVISEGFEDRIAQELGHPIYDPHGDPIPSPDLEVPPAHDHPLSEMQPGQRATVRRVRDTDPGLLRYLSELELVPDAGVEVLERSPYDGNLTMLIDGQQDAIVLGPHVTSQIFVEPG